MRGRAVGSSLLILLAGATGASCSDNDGPAEPPLGFGVDSESHLSDVLAEYRVSAADAKCVASHAFAAGPSTARYADGSYDITQEMLVAAGLDCEVDWSDYDFTTD